MGVCMQRLQRCYISVSGLSSYVCNLHSPVGPFQYAMCLLIYGHLGLHICMLVTFTLGLALTYLWLLQGTTCRLICPHAVHCIPVLVLHACVAMLHSHICVCMLHLCTRCILQVSRWYSGM